VIFDILIVLAVLGAAFVGFQRGFIQPLLAEVLALGSLLILLDNRDGYLAFVSGVLRGNAAVAVVLALVIAGLLGYAGWRAGRLIHRMPSVRGWDGFLGVFVQALVAVLFLYALFSAMLVVGRAGSPSAKTGTLTAAQARLVQQQLDSNRLTAPLGQSPEFRALLRQAAKPGGARVTQAAQLNEVETTYQDLLSPQLAGSRLAPVVMGIGDHVPGYGHFGARDLPER
jgi:hypothetical protein